MNVDRFDGSTEKKTFDSVQAMMLAAVALADDPTVKRIELDFPKPKLTIPKKGKK